MLLQRCYPRDYPVVGWRVVMAVTKMRFRAISRRPDESSAYSRVSREPIGLRGAAEGFDRPGWILAEGTVRKTVR